MKNPITIKDLQQSACFKRNPHLMDKVKKKPAPQKSSKALRWIDKNLHFWCIEKKLTLRKEFEFAPGRKYAADWAIEELKILIEFEGGIFMARGGHNSPTGIQRDIDKYQLAAKLGYTVIRLTAMNYDKLIQDLEEIFKTQNNK